MGWELGGKIDRCIEGGSAYFAYLLAYLEMEVEVEVEWERREKTGQGRAGAVETGGRWRRKG